MPITPPSASSLKNSKTGPMTVKWPASTTSTRVSTSTVPVTSLKADSAITVCDTFGRRPSLSEQGDDDGRVGGGEHRADYKRHQQAHSEDRGGGDDSSGYGDAR
jgi:hypothetical protein